MNFLESFCQLISNESKCDKEWKLLGILEECLRCFALFLNVEIRKASNLAQARKLGQLLFKFSHILCVNFECMNGLSNFVTLKLFRFTRLSFDIKEKRLSFKLGTRRVLQPLTYKSLLSNNLFLNLQALSKNGHCAAVYIHRTIFKIMCNAIRGFKGPEL